MGKYNFQKQVAGMKKLREMLEKARRYAWNELQPYTLAGGNASVDGVESNIEVSMAQLDRMIKDCEGRVKEEKE